MNVIIHPDGRIEYTGVTMEEGLKLATVATKAQPQRNQANRGINNGKRGRPKDTEEVARLTAKQLETLQFLSARDDGTSAHQIAEHFKMTLQAARDRGQRLVKLGVAHVDERGYFYPGEKVEQP